VDLTAPETWIEGQPFVLTRKTKPIFWFSASEPSTYLCGEEGGALGSCWRRDHYRPHERLADGTYETAVAAVDRAGNVDPTPASLEFVIDTTGPAIELVAAPHHDITTAGRPVTARFELRTPELLSSLTCRVDRRQTLPCGNSFSAEFPPRTGHHRVTFRAVDQAGNRTRLRWFCRIDATP
jgi:hypothetical protein